MIAIAGLAPNASASTATGTYTIGTTPGLSVVCSPNCLGVAGFNYGGYTFAVAATSTDLAVALDIIDTSGGAVPFTVCQTLPGDTLCGNTNPAAGPVAPRVDGCGTHADLTTSTVPFRAGLSVSVFVRVLDNPHVTVGIPPTASECPGTALGGELTLTYNP